MSFALAHALGRKNFAEAIAILRKGLTGRPSDANELALIAQCERWRGNDVSARAAADEAVLLDPNCFEAHRILAAIHHARSDHALGLLHARHALRAFVPPPTVPRFVRSCLVVVAWLRGGAKRANFLRAQFSASTHEHTAWQAWAHQYIGWGERVGRLSAANEPPPQKL